MRAFVITIKDNPKSVEMSDRCIKSYKKHCNNNIEKNEFLNQRKEEFNSYEAGTERA